MRVVELIDTLSMGGAQRVVARLAAAAAPRDDVQLTVVALSEPDDPIITDTLRALGVRPTVIEPRTRGNLSDPTMPLRLAAVVRHHDLVHSHLGTANVLGPVAARLARRRSVVTLHTVNPASSEHRSGTDLRRRAMDYSLGSLADSVVAVGASVRDAHAHRTGERPVPVITNPAPPASPVSVEERRAARDLLGVDDDAVRVLVSVGRLEAPKGVDVLLDAMARLPEDVTLLLAGEGSLDAALRAQAEDLGVAERTRFLGNRDDVDLLLSAGDLFVSGSRREGMPMAVLEAMARGLPVIATDVGDVRATVAGAGSVVAPEDPSALAGAVASLLDDPSERAARSQEALRLAVEVHGQDPWADRWIALWGDVVAGQIRSVDPVERSDS